VPSLRRATALAIALRLRANGARDAAGTWMRSRFFVPAGTSKPTAADVLPAAARRRREL
jgi:hypothetical protein